MIAPVILTGAALGHPVEPGLAVGVAGDPGHLERADAGCVAERDLARRRPLDVGHLEPGLAARRQLLDLRGNSVQGGAEPQSRGENGRGNPAHRCYPCGARRRGMRHPLAPRMKRQLPGPGMKPG